ncbi:MAG: helix-turn-helix transcriptional regulator [Pseudomonadota bacterium]
MQLNTDRIRAARESRGWSQSQLARVSGLGLRTVQRIESSGSASFESATALASVLEVGVTDLRARSNAGHRNTWLALCGSGLFAVLVALVYGNVRAEDVLLLDYVYERAAPGDTFTARSEFRVHFEKTATADLGGRLEIDFRGEEQADTVELAVVVYEHGQDQNEPTIVRGVTSGRYGEPIVYRWKKAEAMERRLTVIPTRSTISGWLSDSPSKTQR